jgi:hypothetical protein
MHLEEKKDKGVKKRNPGGRARKGGKEITRRSYEENERD